jgi:hypothetical protein
MHTVTQNAVQTEALVFLSGTTKYASLFKGREAGQQHMPNHVNPIPWKKFPKHCSSLHSTEGKILEWHSGTSQKHPWLIFNAYCGELFVKNCITIVLSRFRGNYHLTNRKNKTDNISSWFSAYLRFILNVDQGRTLTLWPIIDILCSVGWRLNITKSPSRICLSTL